MGGQTQKKWGPEGWGPEGWGPEGWGPEGGGPERWGPKISRFFFHSPATVFFFFSPSLLVFFVEFWWCLKRRGAQMCTFGVLGLSCASPGGPVWWGRRFFFFFRDETEDKSTPPLRTSGGNHTALPARKEPVHSQEQCCPEGTQENYGLLCKPTNLSNDGATPHARKLG